MPAPPIRQEPTAASVLAAAAWYWWAIWKRRALIFGLLLVWTLLVLTVAGCWAYGIGISTGSLRCLP